MITLKTLPYKSEPCLKHKIATTCYTAEIGGMLEHGMCMSVCPVCGWLCLEVIKLKKKTVKKVIKKVKKPIKKTVKKATKKTVKKLVKRKTR